MRYLIFGLILFAFVAPAQSQSLAQQNCEIMEEYIEIVYNQKALGRDKDQFIQIIIDNLEGRMRRFTLTLIDLAYDHDYSREQALSDHYQDCGDYQ